MKLTDILSEVLSKNDWGVYFKAEPLEKLSCSGGSYEDGAKMYRVNEIDKDRLYDAINSTLNEMEINWEKDIKEKPIDRESLDG